MQQCACERNALLHSVTEAFDKAIFECRDAGHFHDFAQAENAALSPNSKRRCEKVEVLMHSHVVVTAEHVGHVPDDSLEPGSVAGAINAVDVCGARGWPRLANENPNSRRLPRPIGP